MIPGIPPDGAELLLLALVINVGLLAIRLGTRLAAERERRRAALAEHAYRDPLPAAEWTLTGAILALARSLKLDQVAEGVEDAAQAHWLSENDCGQAQGYHFARPMPANRITALLDTGAPCTPYPADRVAAWRAALY